jgi:rSAM/selenodomain-associated transferase 2
MSPSFSVIVPALGEEARINRLVDHVRTLGYGRSLEILVADGHPERTTLAALDRPGVVPVPAPLGRARQMNRAAREATGDVLVFLHADCALPPRAFEAMEAALGDGVNAAGAFDLAIRSDMPSLALIARAASIRSRLTRTPYGDQAIFITRAAFEALGGYADLPILEDVDLMRRLRRAGMRLGFAKGRATVSPRRWEAEGVWRRTFANWTIIALYLLGVTPHRLAPLFKTGPARKEK